MRKEVRREAGITLLALVITIIVLLILAGITIGMITGDNGIITKSEDAKFLSNVRQLEEEIDLYKVGEQQKNKTGIDMYPVIQEETMESLDKDEIDMELKKKMLEWASTAKNGEIPTMDTIDYSQFYKLNKEKMQSANSFEGDLYFIKVGNEYKVISLHGENYQKKEVHVLIPLNDIAKPEYITVANNTYKLYGDGTLKVVGELAENSGMTEDEESKIDGIHELNLEEIVKDTDMAINENVETDDTIAKLYGVKKIYISCHTIYVIDANDDLWAWGDNSYNKLGLGHSYLVTEPTKILDGRTEGETGVKAKNVWAGGMNTFVLDTNNQLWACGNNTDGVLGQGNRDIYQNYVKIQISGIDFNNVGITEIVVSDSSQTSEVFIRLENGKVYGAATNNSGQLGIGKRTSITSFTELGQFDTKWNNVKAIENIGISTFMLTKDGTLYGAGYNANGILGLPKTQAVYSLTKIADNIKQIDYIGNSRTLIQDENGKLYVIFYEQVKNINYTIQNAEFINRGIFSAENKLYKVNYANNKVEEYGSEYNANTIPKIFEGSTCGFVANNKIYLENEENIVYPKIKAIYELKNIFDNAIFVQGSGERLSIVDGDGNIYENLNNKNTELSNIRKLISSTHARYAISKNGELYAKGSEYTGVWGDTISKSSYQKITKTNSGDLGKIKDLFTSNAISNYYSASAIVITEDNKIYWAGSDAVTPLPNIDGEVQTTGMGKITKYLTEVNSANIEKIKDKIVNIQYSYINQAGIQGSNLMILTEDGKLYTYSVGNSAKNMTGLNRTVTDIEELKIEPGSTVKEIQTKDGLCLALLNTGEVYGWGYNTYGILGDGYEVGQIYPTPVKLDLKNIRTMSLGDNFAIFETNNGEVYGIGKNDYGQLGTGDNRGAEVFIRCRELEK